ncbi:hypothetical protein Ahy_B10g101868 isoform A [Arachis hypogaea]|uniref:Protein FAR1-RELATED SEQUENCE n=1 Tax=Arachis hypogaea TaxID=3818 RepID=A0A444X0S9_ARAHY|nr:hypothetical protein Ahy_B10g101868 isoform A [Arachis hypogaea]
MSSNLRLITQSKMLFGLTQEAGMLVSILKILNWNDSLMKYGVGNNNWLSDKEIFEDRHLCITIYLYHHFWVGMRSTQMSESVHIFFNKFITRNSSLIQFVKQYDSCLESREQRERIRCSRFLYCHTIMCILTRSSGKVQAQFRGKVNYTTRSTESSLGFTAYKVVEQVSNSIFNKFVVIYDAISWEVKCQCLLFEFRGILCRHSQSVLRFEGVDKVAPRYILEDGV